MRPVSRLCLSLLVLLLGLTLAVPSLAAATVGHERAAQQKVLGKRHAFPYGKGWGTTRPAVIFNGGDPSGLAQDISWTTWGGPRAVGHGKTAIFKPGGGYYGKLVRIRFRAVDVGHCSPSGPPAYRKLWFRVPKKPGGPLRPWTLWFGAKNLCHPFD